MKKIIYLGSIIWLLFAVLPVVAEDCGLRPDKPQLPDGKIADPEEMKDGLDSTGSILRLWRNTPPVWLL